MPEPATHVIDRHAARVVLLDAQDRVLLFRCQEPGAQRAFWITPGGGLEPGETHEQAALRELCEETGLSGVPLGPCVWQRTHTFAWMGKRYRQHERFYLVRVQRHEVNREAHSVEELEALTDYRWWRLQEIHDTNVERFAPSRLGHWLQKLLSSRPDTPIDVGS